MVACREGEPVCSDEASDPNSPFCFVYSTLLRRLGFRLPFTPFERTLLTELNVAPAQLHPNSWAFVRAFAILCCSLSLTSSVDVFLYIFEAKVMAFLWALLCVLVMNLRKLVEEMKQGLPRKYGCWWQIHEVLLESCKRWCGSHGCVCARSS